MTARATWRGLNLRKFQFPAGHQNAGDFDIEAFRRASI